VTRSAVVLVAGRGTRIAAVTTEPKGLLEVNDKSLLDHHLDHLEALGFADVVLVVGYRKDLIEERVRARSSDLRIRLVENERYVEHGNGYSLVLGLSSVAGPCIAIDGDLIYERGVLEGLVREEPTDSLLVGLGDIHDIESTKILVDHAMAIQSVIEKRTLTASEAESFLGEATGLLMFTEEGRKVLLQCAERFFAVRENLPKNWEHLINFVIPQRPLTARYFVEGKWIEIDTPDDYAQACRTFETVRAE
jgi:choline kinase